MHDIFGHKLLLGM